MQSAKHPEVRIAHILEQVEIVTSAIQGTTAEQARSNVILKLAIERAVQIVSEAAKELQAIIGIGNLLRHEYYRINPDDIRDIATVHFPALRAVATKMLVDLNTAD